MIAALLLVALAGGSAVRPDPDPYHNLGPLAWLRKDIPKPTARPEKLKWHDQMLRFSSSALIVADWLTTVDGLRKGYSETNPLLGRHPSLGKLNLMVGAGLLTNAFLVPKLRDPQLRRGIWIAMTLIEIDAVRANHRAGLTLNFRL
jgi:hypothetical protein